MFNLPAVVWGEPSPYARNNRAGHPARGRRRNASSDPRTSWDRPTPPASGSYRSAARIALACVGAGVAAPVVALVVSAAAVATQAAQVVASRLVSSCTSAAAPDSAPAAAPGAPVATGMPSRS